MQIKEKNNNENEEDEMSFEEETEEETNKLILPISVTDSGIQNCVRVAQLQNA